jgi:hypothetical protein
MVMVVSINQTINIHWPDLAFYTYRCYAGVCYLAFLAADTEKGKV